MRNRLIVAAAALLSLTAFPAAAQQTEEPLLDLLAQTFRTRAMRISAYLQVRADFQNERDGTEGTSGFTVPRARVSLRGELDRNITYTIEADLTRNPTFNDAVLRFNFHPAFNVDLGQFKAPFSGERLQSSSTMEFINRAQIVNAFAPGRNIGVQLRGALGESGLNYSAGIFNGNSQRSAVNDNNHFMYAGRLLWRTASTQNAGDGFEIAVNALRSNDEAVSLGYAFGSTFRGVRTLVGADMRATLGPWLATAEWTAARLEDGEDDSVGEPDGYQGSLSYSLNDSHTLHGRWDSINGDGMRSDRDLAIIGWTYRISTPVKFQVNMVLPSGESASRRQILSQVQLVF